MPTRQRLAAAYREIMTFDDTSPAADAGTEELTAPGGAQETVRDTWDDSEDPSTAVVEAVAAVTGQDPLEMPCLYDSLDVEALDGLLTSDRAEARGNVAVSFAYDGAFVWVDSGGAIKVDPDATSAE